MRLTTDQFNAPSVFWMCSETEATSNMTLVLVGCKTRVHSLTRLLARSLAHLLTHSLTHLLTHLRVLDTILRV